MKEVVCKYGILRGVEEGDSIVYKGIPYAKPPVGALRFCPPQEAEPWEGVRLADAFPNRSYMPVSDGTGFYDREFYSDPRYETPYSEDCLYLNIWQPKMQREHLLPVAFWIHGGGFDHGCGHEMEFDGQAYNQRGVLLVTINYRVGALGFLAHPWLAGENEDGVSGNYGLMDQIFALKWVRENIEAFGGDPENITVFGQSAGSISTQILTASPLTRSWIAKAILQSGLSYHNGVLSHLPRREAEKIGEEYVQFCGITSVEELRQADPRMLLRKQVAFGRFHPEYGLCFSPNADGVLLEDPLETVTENGRIKDIPYMIGSTKDDLWVTDGMRSQGRKGPLYESIEAWSKCLAAQGRKPPYVYYFTRALPGDSAGAFHSSELWYMFGTLPRCWRPMQREDAVLSGEMLDAWTDFMKYGDPGKSWKPYDHVQVFDLPGEKKTASRGG